VQGRLTKDEFDGRVELTFAARTYAELTRLTADLPVIAVTARPQPASPQPVPAPAPKSSRPVADAEVQAGSKAIARTAVITVLLWAAAIVTFNGAVFIAAFGATCTVLAISALTGGRLLGLWTDQFR
jgi:hypothetical protein